VSRSIVIGGGGGGAGGAAGGAGGAGGGALPLSPPQLASAMQTTAVPLINNPILDFMVVPQRFLATPEKLAVAPEAASGEPPSGVFK
jgi:hypothetical protein